VAAVAALAILVGDVLVFSTAPLLVAAHFPAGVVTALELSAQ